MRSTGIGSDPVFAHATPHSGPCAVLPPDNDVPHRKSRMIATQRFGASKCSRCVVSAMKS